MILTFPWLALVASLSAQNTLPTVEQLLQPLPQAKSEPVMESLEGKVMCGYQGWFTTAGDGSALPWTHWTTNRSMPNEKNIRVEMWPDLSEYGREERYATELFHTDGRKAELFSSVHPQTVRRHFSWMMQYGIDGVFVQRFATALGDPRVMQIRTHVLAQCRLAANQEGRAYAVMYDLSGLKQGETKTVIEDWKRLSEQMKITSDGSYVRHRGKPLVAIWGLGFSDNRKYTLQECEALIDFFREQGCSLMIGVPTWWRQLKGDAVADPELHRILKKVDVISPWTVGRYRDQAGIERHQKEHVIGDMAWCDQEKIDYLPVVFPGFSWRNMNRDQAFDAIPRQGGQFLWSQCVAAKQQKAKMLYVAMFDEVDEGTAIFKCTSDTPDTGDVKFLREPSLPSDHYLKVTGAAGKMLRGEMPVVEKVQEAVKSTR